VSDTPDLLPPYDVPRKWRPSVAQVTSAVLAAVMLLPLLGLFFVRIYENQLIRQTETELIGQSAALSVIIAREASLILPSDAQLGAAVPPSVERLQPVLPALDVASGDLLPRRPDAMPADKPPTDAMLALGARMFPDMMEIQRLTLAGFRLLDHNGVVISGREEIGQSLAHIEEVKMALGGSFKSIIRLRSSDSKSPSLQSVSRGTALRVFVAMPFVVRGQVAGVVYASRTPSSVWKNLYEERQKLLAVLVVVLFATAILGLIAVRAITGPIRALIRSTRAIAGGDRTAVQPLGRHGTRELAELTQSFLDMSRALQTRSDYVATFAQHVSHELKSPLTSIQGAAELMRDDLDPSQRRMSPDDRRRFLDNIVADTDRLTAIVKRLRDLARAEQPGLLGESRIGEALPALRSTHPALDVQIAGASDTVIPMSAENAGILLGHLADNAARHGASTLVLRPTLDGTGMRLLVSNNGKPISEANTAKVFDAFFTTRREEGGTGMGLAIVRSLVEAHGGVVRLIERDPVTFEMRWSRLRNSMPQT
jgi:signal transduction histidine kinase